MGMFGKLAGVVAIVASGIWARGKEKNRIGPSAFVAAIGGIWCAVAWFNWPMTKRVIPGGFFSIAREVSEFSILGFVGVGLFALFGLTAWAVIAFRGDRIDNS
jgi:hypothetical protein